MKQIYKTKGKHRNPMARKLPGTVMKKRKRHREAEKGREGEREKWRKGKRKHFQGKSKGSGYICFI